MQTPAKINILWSRPVIPVDVLIRPNRDASAFTRIRSAVRESGGKCLAVMHPGYYERFSYFPDPKLDMFQRTNVRIGIIDLKYEGYRHSLDLLISTSNVPVFVFLGSGCSVPESLKGRDHVAVHTVDNDPKPDIPGSVDSWMLFGRLLSLSLRVKEISIAGEYYFPPKYEGNTAKGCVAGGAREMGKYVNVKILEDVTFPNIPQNH